MRHNKKFNHLGRTTPHRKAMLSNMACSLIEHKRINTTVAKAKALRMYLEPLLTRSKEDSTHNRRIVFSSLQNKYAIQELFKEISPKISDRPGGYLRIIKTGFRLGDGADMAMIEFVDYNDIYNPNEDTKKSSRRSRRGAKKSSQSNTSAIKVEDKNTEVVSSEVEISDENNSEKIDNAVEETENTTNSTLEVVNNESENTIAKADIITDEVVNDVESTVSEIDNSIENTSDEIKTDIEDISKEIDKKSD